MLRSVGSMPYIGHHRDEFKTVMKFLFFADLQLIHALIEAIESALSKVSILIQDIVTLGRLGAMVTFAKQRLDLRLFDGKGGA